MGVFYDLKNLSQVPEGKLFGKKSIKKFGLYEKMFYLCVSPKLTKMTRQEVVGLIYQHIQNENEMGLPPQESWEGIFEGTEWVDECIKNGYTLNQLQNELFDEAIQMFWDSEE